MSKRVQPPWSPPVQTNTPVLKLYNSLTRQKEVFVPLKGKRINWYSCGPTVYDASHMGHARSYITFDILRRVLSDYFGYDILYIMNITDIDDKIIKRARQNYLYEKYISENHSLEKILQDSKDVLNNLSKTTQEIVDPDKKQMYESLLKNLTKSVDALEEAVKSKNEIRIEEIQKEFLENSKDPLSDWLDSKFGHTITDNKIFSALPQYWEEEFHKDMEALNILKPDVLTRVSEYMPEVIEFIKKIISNGFAYEANGSVYFDVAAFDQRDNHFYAKLVPEAYGDTNSLQEGEGVLSSSEQCSEKRSLNDFALWKRSKPGEPAWDSPWGKGRPGWHIECSAMASAIVNGNLDIHTGGVDLKFPHHDNEMAQSEAYFNNPNWVKYFLHSGHLTIAGCKMSKSLKNFVSIKDALKNYTARQLRFAFLLHSWKDTLDYSPNTMESALQCEKMFNEFFLNVKDRTRFVSSTVSSFTKWTESELNLNNALQQTKERVHLTLCDNIDTRGTLEALRDLVTTTNLYLNNNLNLNYQLLQDIAVYITKILTIFGTITEPIQIGFPISQFDSTKSEDIIMPYLEILSEFRDNVRTSARTLKAVDILKECDKLRDDILPNVGVRLEDRENGKTAIKLVDKESLLKEKKAKEEATLAKEQRKLELAKAKEAKEKQKRIPPHEMFKLETDKYSKFDERGLPTHDSYGKELSKGQIKKLQKLQQAQEKVYLQTINS